MKRRRSKFLREYSNVLIMEDVSSMELFLEDGCELRQVLYDINLNIKKKEVWGITGRPIFDTKLLLEIIANIKPYNDGRTVLLERGMMRRKRIILPHVFYAAAPDMIYNNMNVLEFLMFATAKKKRGAVLRQKKIFELLISMGLERISLSPIYSLTKEYKSIIILLSAYFSMSQLIVFNFPDYEYSQEQIQTLKQISKLIRDDGRNLVLSSEDSKLIGEVCTHIAFLLNGNIKYAGTVEEFRLTYDKIILTIWDRDLEGILYELKAKLPQYEYKVLGGSLVVSEGISGEVDIKQIYREIATAGVVPERICVNSKTTQNACEEVLKYYDL